MSESNSTSAAPVDKTDRPAGRFTKVTKPRPDFPLTPHRAGYWCKKIRGVIHYFGPRWRPGDQAAATAAADAALKEYNEKAEALHSGRKPRPENGSLTVKELVNGFLNAKQAAVDAGELSPRTWACYKEACDVVIVEFGKSRLASDLAPEDFAALRKRMAKRWGAHGLGTRIQCVRSLFKWGFDADLIDRPVRFGPDFKRPSKKTLRIHKAKQGAKLFTAAEVRALVDGALTVGSDGPGLVRPNVQLRAMLLLGINCGFGNADCGTLPLSAVDLENAVIDFPRPKTGIARRCPLWPETVAAIREALASRPEPKKAEHAGLVFVTKYGGAWHDDKGSIGNRAIAHEMNKLLVALGISGRSGLGFYTLRHTFRTVADAAKDQPAADYIMGHEVPHMSSVYRETIEDERLRAVVDHVRAWLFPPPKKEKRETTGTADE